MAGDSGQRRSSGSGCIEVLKTMTKEDIIQILSQGLCLHCDHDLQIRLQNLNQRKLSDLPIIINDEGKKGDSNLVNSESSEEASLTENMKVDTSRQVYMQTPEVMDDRNGKEDVYACSSVPDRNNSPFRKFEHELFFNDRISNSSLGVGNELIGEEREHLRFEQVNRRNFSFLERANGGYINILEGLELHTDVFNIEEQNEIVQFVYKLQHIGREGMLQARTYSETRKWIRGKRRVTIQFGCCYNYAKDTDGNLPGIAQDVDVDPLPIMFKQMIKRMVRFHVLPPSCVPDSCIVNIYEQEDCIPPHIDHHDFVRPFCTVSLLSECDILLGTSLKVLSLGEFSGPVCIPLPVGSVMVFKGNGADVAKHCIPSVPAKRISITLRKMDDSKLPFNYSHDPELLNIKPLIYYPSSRPSAPDDHNQHKRIRHENPRHARETRGNVYRVEDDDFSSPRRSIQPYKMYPRDHSVGRTNEDIVYHGEGDDFLSQRRSIQPYRIYPPDHSIGGTNDDFLPVRRSIQPYGNVPYEDH